MPSYSVQCVYRMNEVVILSVLLHIVINDFGTQVSLAEKCAGWMVIGHFVSDRLKVDSRLYFSLLNKRAIVFCIHSISAFHIHYILCHVDYVRLIICAYCFNIFLYEIFPSYSIFIMIQCIKLVYCWILYLYTEFCKPMMAMVNLGIQNRFWLADVTDIQIVQVLTGF